MNYEPKMMKILHKIMEGIYKEEKNLSPVERVKKIRDESEKFIKERNLKIRRLSRKIF